MEIAYYDTQSAHQALYPNITISADLGWSNGEEGTVNPGTLLAKALASIVQPIFAQGKLRARYRNAGIEQEKVRLQFEQTLLNAGNEVYRYMHICQKTEEKVQHLRVMVNALHEAYLGTKELMNNGTNTYLEVLKAQEDLLTAQLREVENHNDGVQALINLYIALGGAVE
jgi:outer membrane protein TolC